MLVANMMTSYLQAACVYMRDTATACAMHTQWFTCVLYTKPTQAYVQSWPFYHMTLSLVDCCRLMRVMQGILTPTGELSAMLGMIVCQHLKQEGTQGKGLFRYT